MARSEGFDVDLFKNIQPRETKETVLRELKRQLYDLSRLDERAEFICDAIAMANAVRRTGKTGYLMFGYTESLIVFDQSHTSVYPKSIDLTVDERMNRNERELIDCIDAYVMPMPDVEFQWGWYDGPVDVQALVGDATDEDRSLNAGIVAYLAFRFMPTGPYTVKKVLHYSREKEDGTKVQDSLDVGDTWTRIGAGKGRKLRPIEHYLLVSHSDIPYVRNEIWQKYSVNRPRDSEPRYYQPMNGNNNIVNDLALELSKLWIRTSKQPFLYIYGDIGSGKSTLLKQINNQLLDDLEQNTSSREKDELPSLPIPVYISLNGLEFPSQASVSRQVIGKINQFNDLGDAFRIGRESQKWQRRLLDSYDYNFMLLLDGLDELEDSADQLWKRSFHHLQDFVEQRSGRVRAIMTARTGTLPWIKLPTGWGEIELLPFQDIQIQKGASLLSQDVIRTPFDAMSSEDDASPTIVTQSRKAEAVKLLLDANPSLHSLVSNPLIMETVFDYIEQSSLDFTYADFLDPIVIGQIIHEIVTAVMRHESSKDLTLQRDDLRIRRRNALAKLAWRMDGAREFVGMDEIGSIFDTAELHRVRQMGILQILSEGMYGFASALFKPYFAAQHALGLILQIGKTVDWKHELSHAQLRSDFWPLCAGILDALIYSEDVRPLAAPFYEQLGMTSAAQPQ